MVYYIVLNCVTDTVVMKIHTANNPRGRLGLPQLLFSTVSVSEIEGTTTLYENCPI